MSEKTDTVEKHESGLTSLSEEDLDNIAGGGKTTYYEIRHNTGCGGTFDIDEANYPPQYCPICGGTFSWSR